MVSPSGMSGLGLDEGPKEWRQNAVMLMAGIGLAAFGASELWRPTFRSTWPTLGILFVGIGVVLLLVAWRRVQSLTGGSRRSVRSSSTKKAQESVLPPREKETSTKPTYKWEQRVETIPLVLIALHGKPKPYAAVLSDQRIIFVARGGDGLFGKKKDPKGTDPYQGEPAELADAPDSIVIPYGSLRKLGIRKGDKGAFRIELRYEREDGMEDALDATLLPPEKLFAEGKSKGTSREDVEQQYAEAARSALQKAIPSLR